MLQGRKKLYGRCCDRWSNGGFDELLLECSARGFDERKFRKECDLCWSRFIASEGSSVSYHGFIDSRTREGQRIEFKRHTCSGSKLLQRGSFQCFENMTAEHASELLVFQDRQPRRSTTHRSRRARFKNKSPFILVTSLRSRICRLRGHDETRCTTFSWRIVFSLFPFSALFSVMPLQTNSF
jgi:hypothetical protein